MRIVRTGGRRNHGATVLAEGRPKIEGGALILEGQSGASCFRYKIDGLPPSHAPAEGTTQLLGTLILRGGAYEIVGPRPLTEKEVRELNTAVKGGGVLFFGTEFRLRPVGWVETAADMEGARSVELRGSGVEVSSGGTVNVKGE